MATTDLRPLSVGEILDVSFQLYRRLFASLVVVQAICTAVPFLLNMYVESAGGAIARPVLYVVALLLSTALTALASVACILVISEHYLGHRLSPGEAVSRAKGYILPVILLSLLVWFAIAVGMLLLIIPGIILMCGLALATQTLVLESGRSPTAAMSRSWELTKGFRLRMLALIITAGCIVVVPVLGFAAIGGIFAGNDLAQPGTTPLIFMLLGGAVQIAIYPLIYCILTVAYYDLRVRKEAFDLQMLEKALQGA